MIKKYSLTSKSLFLAIIALPVTFIITKLFDVTIKAWNPSHVDTSLGLAYLGYILMVGFGTFSILAASALVMGVKAFRNKERFAWLSIVITLAEIIIVVVASALRQLSN